MGCSNFVTRKNLLQLITWRPVPSDKRYEEEISVYRSGRMTRVTRVAGQTTQYPHYTEFYDTNGRRDNYKNNPMWDAHYSRSEDDDKRKGAHKTAQAILDDLDEAIKSLRSNR